MFLKIINYKKFDKTDEIFLHFFPILYSQSKENIRESEK